MESSSHACSNPSASLDQPFPACLSSGHKCLLCSPWPLPAHPSLTELAFCPLDSPSWPAQGTPPPGAFPKLCQTLGAGPRWRVGVLPHQPWDAGLRPSLRVCFLTRETSVAERMTQGDCKALSLVPDAKSCYCCSLTSALKLEIEHFILHHLVIFGNYFMHVGRSQNT